MWFKLSLLHDYAFFTTSFYYIRINLLHIQEEDCINCLQNKQLTRTPICAAHSFCMKKASRLEEKCQLIFCRCWSPVYGMLQMILFCTCVIWMHGICEAENTLIPCTQFPDQPRWYAFSLWYSFKDTEKCWWSFLFPWFSFPEAISIQAWPRLR